MTSRSLIGAAFIGVACAAGYGGYSFGKLSSEVHTSSDNLSTSSVAFLAHKFSAVNDIWVLHDIERGDLQTAAANLDYALSIEIAGLSPNYLPTTARPSNLRCYLAQIRQYRVTHPTRAPPGHLHDLESEVLTVLPTPEDLQDLVVDKQTGLPNCSDVIL